MPRSQKRNSLIIVGLAALFYWSFMFMKHDPALRDVIPFGVDPYDAVGSFGVIIGMLIALLSLVRAFRPYRTHPPSSAQRLYLARAQMAVVLSILITLVADAVAMARHTSAWMQAASRIELLIVLACMATITVAVGALVRRSVKPDAGKMPGSWTRATVISLVSVLLLVVYPEQFIGKTTTHLLTVLVGDLLLFVPLRALLTAIVPEEAQRIGVSASSSGKSLYGWGLATLVGIVIGALLFVAEMTEGGGGSAPRLAQLMLIACVFVGLATMGLLIAYAFMGGPLGLWATEVRDTRCIPLVRVGGACVLFGEVEQLTEDHR